MAAARAALRELMNFSHIKTRDSTLNHHFLKLEVHERDRRSVERKQLDGEHQYRANRPICPRRTYSDSFKPSESFLQQCRDQRDQRQIDEPWGDGQPSRQSSL